jgi:hypothetical protein
MSLLRQRPARLKRRSVSLQMLAPIGDPAFESPYLGQALVDTFALPVLQFAQIGKRNRRA